VEENTLDYQMVVRQFVVTIIEEDLPGDYEDDLEDVIRETIGEKFGFDADISFSVNEIK
jgi:hypothetical protein